MTDVPAAMLPALRIVALCVGLAVLYGVLHDSVTVRVCPEYFTIGHPPILGGTADPWLLALGWGVLATWWVGAGLGVLLAYAARRGPLPSLDWRDLVRPVLAVLGVTAASALGAGLLGWWLARAGLVWLTPSLAAAVPEERHVVFLADLWAHSAAYLVAAAGGVVVALWTRRRRRHAAAVPSTAATSSQ